MRRFFQQITLWGWMLLLPLAACQAQSVGGEAKEQLSGAVVPDKEGMTVKGVVADESGKPVAGVVVNDGFHFATTDAAGVYYLPSDLVRSKYVSVSVPTAYRIQASKGVADGYYARLAGGQATNRYDFVLQTRPDPLSAFEYVAMEQFADEDQAFIDMKKGKAEGYKTAHLFRVKPTKGVKHARIEVVNRFGEIYSQDVKF